MPNIPECLFVQAKAWFAPRPAAYILFGEMAGISVFNLNAKHT